MARTDEDRDRPLSNRIFWFMLLWLASVGVVGTVAFLIRSWLL